MELTDSDKKKLIKKNIKKGYTKTPKLNKLLNSEKLSKKEAPERRDGAKEDIKKFKNEDLDLNKKLRIKSSKIEKGSKILLQRIQLPKTIKPPYEEVTIKTPKKLVDRITKDIQVEKSKKLRTLLHKYIKDKDYKKIYSLLIWLNTNNFNEIKENFALRFGENPDDTINELINELKFCRIKTTNDSINSKTVKEFIEDLLNQAGIFDDLYKMCKNSVLKSPEHVRRGIWLLSQYESKSQYSKGYLKTYYIFAGDYIENIEEELIKLGIIFKVKEEWSYADEKWIIPKYATRLIEEIKYNPNLINIKIEENLTDVVKNSEYRDFLTKLFKHGNIIQKNENYKDFIEKIEKEWNINSLEKILSDLIKSGIIIVDYSPAWSSRRHYYPEYYTYKISPFAAKAETITKIDTKTLKDSTQNLDTELAKYSIDGEPPENSVNGKEKDFETLEETTWISNIASLVTTDEPNIILINGVEGMGFNVIKDLLKLEIEDRGHEPNLIILKIKEEEKYHEIPEIQDKIAYNKIICIETDPKQLINIISKNSGGLFDDKMEKIATEIEQALSKGSLRHIVIENKVPVSQKIDPEIYEKSKECIRKLTDKPITEVDLTYSPKGLKLAELNFREIDESIIRKLINIFAKILQVKLNDDEIKELIVSSFFKDCKNLTGKIDAIWDKIYTKRNSAIDKLKNKFGPGSKVFKVLPASEKLENESLEHFIIKQVVVKELIKRDYQNFVVEKESEIEGTKWEVSEVDGITCTKFIEIEKNIKDKSGKIVKRPDITINYPKKIWIEIETGKSLKFPLDYIFDKLLKIEKMDTLDAPEELWIVLPFRKLLIYGKKLIKTKIYDYFERYYKSYKKLKPRIFLADLQDEKLIEVKF